MHSGNTFSWLRADSNVQDILTLEDLSRHNKDFSLVILLVNRTLGLLLSSPGPKPLVPKPPRPKGTRADTKIMKEGSHKKKSRRKMAPLNLSVKKNSGGHQEEVVNL